MSAPIAKLTTALTANGGVLLRYLATSAINVINHQVLLQLALRQFGWGGGLANVFAAMTSVIPAYFLSRYWVWQVTGKSSVRTEILPFWIIAVIGLVASTVAAEVADRRFVEPLAVSAASLGAYLVVWVIKFVVLNVLFKRASEKAEMTAA